MAQKVAAAAKAVSNQGSPESIAQRKVTRQANSELVIDYGTARDEGSFSASGRQSFWVLKLNKLALDCADEDSPAEFGKMYQIGTFGTTSTAQSTKKRIETDHVNELSGVFTLKAERTADGSALWAAAFEPGAEGDDEWETKLTPVAGNDDDE